MLVVNDLIEQLKIVAPILRVVYIILFSLLFLVFIIVLFSNIPVSFFTRDPSSIFHASPFVGVISSIGILSWSSTAAICFFASAILFKKGSVKIATFLLFSGLLTSFLLLDDLFQFHEYFFPRYLHIPEKFIYAGYFFIVLTYLIKFRSIIFQTEYIVLFLAFSFLGLSIISDLILPGSNMGYLIEDGLKLFGIITWFIFFTRTSFTQIQQIL